MMLEIVYRIYEKTDDYRDQYRKEITMDCLICESRERFKEIIRDTYGNDMAFAKSKNLEVGDLYCIIIGEHCWNTDKYFNRVEFLCDGCGLKVITHIKPVAIDEHTVRHRLFGEVVGEYDTFNEAVEGRHDHEMVSERRVDSEWQNICRECQGERE